MGRKRTMTRRTAWPFTERVRLPGKEIALPVMGTFDVVDGKIAAWRDYFDMNQFMSQLSA